MALPRGDVTKDSIKEIWQTSLKAMRAMHKEADYTALAIGPGLSKHPETAKFVLLALNSLPLPAVVDADALNILAAQENSGVRQFMQNRKHLLKPGCRYVPIPSLFYYYLGSIIKVDSSWASVTSPVA